MRLSKITSCWLDEIIIACLMKKQAGKCVECKGELKTKGFQIAHKRYGEDITLKDINLKCGVCHAKEHGKKGVCGRVRKH